MKRINISLIILCATAISYISCSKDEAIPLTYENKAVRTSMIIEAFNELDLKTGLNVTAQADPGAKPSDIKPGECSATITQPNPSEGYPKVYLVDFGTGCTQNQISRYGKLRITITGALNETGSKLKIEREGYAINGMPLEGIIEYTNTTSDQTQPQWTKKVTNGKLTDAEGTVFTNSGTHTVKQIAGVETPYNLNDNIYEITEGTHTVSSSKEGALTLTVQEPLIKKYSCEYISKGKLKIQGNIKGVIDYGNNDCDKNYIYTNENGIEFPLSL